MYTENEEPVNLHVCTHAEMDLEEHDESHETLSDFHNESSSGSAIQCAQPSPVSAAHMHTAHAVTATSHWSLLFLLLWSSFYGISATAMNHLLRFLHYLFSKVAPYSHFIAALVTVFPTSLYMLRKKFELSGDKFKKYVVCPRCHSLYELEKCFESASGAFLSTYKFCSFVAFPYHHQRAK